MHSPRLTFDASHTANSGKNTGIERVVRNLSQQLPSVAFPLGLESPQTVTHLGDAFFPIDAPQQKAFQILADWEANATKFLPDWLQAIPKALAQSIGTLKAKKWMTPAPSHLGIYKSAHQLYKSYTQTARWMRGGPTRPSPQDILILPDAYWTKRSIWPTVARYRQSGTFVASIVYDLIPLTHPQFVGAKRSEKFQGYLEQLIRHSDLIVAISKTVRDDVRHYIDQRKSTASGICREVESFPLGAELHHCHGPVRPEIETLFATSASHAPYLMVASIDPRKNHTQALDAFELLWQRHPGLQLCFAGRVGGACSELIERIHRHPLYRKNLHLFHDLSDAELQHAYRGCSGVLLPSIVEGFGLPIVESLWHGKKTFASDTPIHREVGGNACVYFPLFDPNALAQAIEAWDSKRTSGGHATFYREHATPTTWEQSASHLLQVVLEAYHRKTHAGAIHQRAA
jgi:glycosyltransferase involved in cell wall biosynthesis